jgi:hypothetical protein
MKKFKKYYFKIKIQLKGEVLKNRTVECRQHCLFLSRSSFASAHNLLLPLAWQYHRLLR